MTDLVTSPTILTYPDVGTRVLHRIPPRHMTDTWEQGELYGFRYLAAKMKRVRLYPIPRVLKQIFLNCSPNSRPTRRPKRYLSSRCRVCHLSVGSGESWMSLKSRWMKLGGQTMASWHSEICCCKDPSPCGRVPRACCLEPSDLKRGGNSVCRYYFLLENIRRKRN